MKHPYPVDSCKAFTLIELLVVIVTLGILTVVLVPALGQGKTRDRGMSCMNDQRQLVMAAKMYADDNQDNWVPNFPGEIPGWVTGLMNWDSGNPDNTNIERLVNPNNPYYSVMGPYIKNPVIFRCPGDDSYVLNEGERVRSVSMNGAVGTVSISTGQLAAGSAVNGQWLGGNNIGNSRQSTWRTYGKTSSMVNPTPASLWIFADEHPDSISDASFAVEMAKTGPFATIIDCPASFHDGAGGFSFADGHAEIHRWIGSFIKRPVVNGGSSIGNGVYGGGSIGPDSGNIADVTWLQSHTSAHM